MLISKHGFVAILVAGLILAGILASTMSTSDSQAAGCIFQYFRKTCWAELPRLKAFPERFHDYGSCNRYRHCSHRRISGKKSGQLRIPYRILCLGRIWCDFGAVMLFSLFWKRANRNGALAGMIVGGAMVFIWKYLIAPIGGIFGIYELLPAFICSAVAIVVVSLLTAPPSQEIVDEFESLAE